MPDLYCLISKHRLDTVLAVAALQSSWTMPAVRITTTSKSQTMRAVKA